MGNPWSSAIKSAKTLTLFVAPSIEGGIWKLAVQNAVADFNKLMTASAIGVSVTISKDAPKEDGTGANLSIQTGNGSVAAPWGGDSGTAFDGKRLHGLTISSSIQGVSGGVPSGPITRTNAFIFVPATPQINTPKGQRPVGEGVMRVIAVHEFVHACGLENKDHAIDDLFQGYPSVDYGATPQGDAVLLPGNQRMPPLVLGSGTISKLKTMWP